MMRQEKVLRFSAQWREQQAATVKLSVAIEAKLKEVGLGE